MKRLITDGSVVAPWVRQKSGGTYHPGDVGIGLEIDGVLGVGVTYDGYTGTSISIHSRCDSARAPNRYFYWAIFDYPFNQLGVQWVRGIVCSTNEKAIRLDEHLGFKQEAILRGYFPEGDAIIYAMQRADCKWLALGERHARVLQKAA